MSNSGKPELIFNGIAASPGIAIGSALVFNKAINDFSEPVNINISPNEVEIEFSNFDQALDKTRRELESLQQQLDGKLDAYDATIFDAHLLIVDDQGVRKEVKEMIRRKLKPANYSFYKVIERYIAAISAMQDEYIKERADDIKDVASRILANLNDTQRFSLDKIDAPKIIVAKNLTPSDTSMLNRKYVLGFAVETGSNTSHTAILARSMRIPAIVGVDKQIFEQLSDDSEIILDGFSGTIIINPEPLTLQTYRNKLLDENRFYVDLVRESRLRPETSDGFTIQLVSNLERLEEVETARKFGAGGIGLFRTEYIFINAEHLPDEQEQFDIYRQLVQSMDGEPVVIRTLDIGGDKMEKHIVNFSESNPFLGLRAVRLCLRERPDIFKTQIRAILRASAFGNAKIMFPMISCADEVIELKDLMDKLKSDLSREGIDYNPNIEAGIMIETPAAAIMAPTLSGMVDFFSIGTNDLVQYTMAIDRSNEKVAYLYQPSHPAILELIHRVVHAAEKHNIWVSVCGQMAGEPIYTPLLVGLGVHELSMSPTSLGPVRRIIRKISMHEAEKVAQEAMKCSTASEAIACSREFLKKITNDLRTGE